MNKQTALQDYKAAEAELHMSLDTRQHYVLCNGAGREFIEAQDKLLISTSEFLDIGFVASGGVSHAVQRFDEKVFIHYLCQAMVKEVDRAESEKEEANKNV